MIDAFSAAKQMAAKDSLVLNIAEDRVRKMTSKLPDTNIHTPMPGTKEPGTVIRTGGRRMGRATELINFLQHENYELEAENKKHRAVIDELVEVLQFTNDLVAIAAMDGFVTPSKLENLFANQAAISAAIKKAKGE